MAVKLLSVAGIGLLILGVLSGCSAPGQPSKPTESKSSVAANPTWRASDLAKLLGEVQSQLGPGTILTDDQIKANLAKSGGGDLLTRSGATVVPSKCGAILKKDIPANPEDLGEGVSTVAADLNYGPTSISVTSTPGKQLPNGLASGIGQAVYELASVCPSITLTIPSTSGSQSVGVAFQKVPIPTDAERTYAFQETVAGSTPTVVTAVRAIDGNLVIGISSTQTDATIFPALVNAVVAAARAHSFG